MSNQIVSNQWTAIKLGNLLTRIKDSVTIEDLEVYQRLTIHLHNKGISQRDEVLGSEIGTKKQFIVHGGQFLMSKIDARNGAFGIVPDSIRQGVITGNFWAYDVDHLQLYPPYFNYLTYTYLFQDFCIRSSSGTTNRLYLQEEAFLSQEILLPPLGEQCRLVAKLDALATRVEQALALQQAACDQAVALIEATAATIFSKELEKNWPIKSIEEICSVGGGLQKSPARKPNEHPIPYLRVANVQRNRLDLNEIKELEVSPNELERYRLMPGDVLVVEGNGSIDNIGRAALWQGEIENCVHQNHIIRLRPDARQVIGGYLSMFLNSPVGKKQAASLSVTTSGLYVLSSGKIKQIKLPMPPLNEQERIVSQFEQVQMRIYGMLAVQDQSLKELAALLPSIMDRAFRGEL